MSGGHDCCAIEGIRETPIEPSAWFPYAGDIHRHPSPVALKQALCLAFFHAVHTAPDHPFLIRGACRVHFAPFGLCTSLIQ